MELALVFVLELAGMALGVALARAAFAARPQVAVARVVAAVERATRAFLARANARVVATGALVALGVLGGGLVFGRGGAGVAGGVGVVLGVALGVLSAFLASVLGGRTGAGVIVRAHLRFDLALSTAVRGAGAIGVLSQALAVLGVLGLLGGGFFLHRGANSGNPAELARLAAQALPGYALGAAVVALLLHFTAGTYGSAARGGLHFAHLLEPASVRQETKNPALVSGLVGSRLEQGAAAARLFAASAGGAVGAVMLAATVGAGEVADVRFAALPLLLWSFGLVANGSGLFVVRSLEAQGASVALARGLGSSAVVSVVGVLGSAYWLFPDAWPWLAGAGAVGLVGGALAPFATARAFARRRGPLREALDGLRAGPATAQAAAFGFGLGNAAFGVLVLGLAGLAAAHLGVESGVPGGARLALLLALFGAMAWSPYTTAVEGAAGIAESARGIAAMGGTDADATARIQRIAESSQVAAFVARAHQSLTQVLGALALAVGGSAGSADGTAPGEGGAPWVVLVGMSLVLAATGLSARRAARGAREVALEAERQLTALPGELPAEGRTPSYRACEEVAGRVGLGGLVPGISLVLLGPVLLGIALSLVYRGSGPRLAAEAFATFVAGAAVTALGVALAVDGARAVLAGARRANHPEGDPATHAASVTGNALAEIFGSAAGPAACTVALLTASLALFIKTLIP